MATAVAIVATAMDTTDSLSSVKLYHRAVGDSLYAPLDMVDQGSGTYRAEIPAASMTANGAEYRLVAADNYGLQTVMGTADQPLRIQAMSNLTVTNTTGMGSVSSDPAGIDCGSTCSATYAANATVTLTATPNANVDFAGWGDDCASSGNDATCTLTMESARTASVSFVQNGFPIAVNADPVAGGEVNCVDNPVNAGDDSVCSASANPGYAFTGWRGDCQHAGITPNCTLTAVNSAKSVTAGFALNAYAITTEADPTEGGTVTCSANPVNHGANSTCTAVASAGYSFVNWTGHCSGSDATCELRAVNGDRSVTGRFQRTAFTIQTAVNPQGTGTVTCSPNPVPNGESSTCSATPNAGYSFRNWSGDCTGTDCRLVRVTSDKSVVADFVTAGPLATQSAGDYTPGALLTITGQFNDASGAEAQSLTWVPLLPEGWQVESATGDGNPEVAHNEILFTGNLRRLPLNFSYRVSIPNTARGEQMIAAEAVYQSSTMDNPRRLLVEPDPLFLDQLPIVRHSADYDNMPWVISVTEASRVLAHWRAGAYHVATQGVDGYGYGSGSTTGDLHAADYQEPFWRIDSFETARVLAYWRAGAYHVQPDTADGYAPGDRQRASQPFDGISATTAAPSATQTAGTDQYTPGATLTITSTVGRSGDGSLLSLVWLPKLPSDWTITAVTGDGAPELNPGRNQILLTGSNLQLPLTFSYTVQIPPGASGRQRILADFEYWWSDREMENPDFASLSPLELSDGGGSTGDCDRGDVVLTTSITSGTVNRRSETSIRTQGTVTVASGAGLELTARRITLDSGFRVAQGGRLNATSATVTCPAVSHAPVATTASNARAAQVNPASPWPLTDPEHLPVWLSEHLARLGIDFAAVHGGLLDAEERWFILETDQALDPRDHNGLSDLYRLDLLSDRLELISLTEDNLASNGASRYAAADASGERVVFESDADNLVPGDDNGVSDLFLRDLSLGRTERLTYSEQASAHPAVDALGLSLVYDQASLDGPRRILGQALTDGAAGEALWVSDPAEQADAYRPAISADGRFLAYLSRALATAADQTTPALDCTIVLRDLANGMERRENCPAALHAVSDQARPAFAADGRTLHWSLPGEAALLNLINPLMD